jgi:hypothetical protein
MKYWISSLTLVLLATATAALAQVNIAQPADGAQVSPSTTFVASAQPAGCPNGVATMGIYVDNQLVYVSGGSNLNASITLPEGQHRAVVQEWDYCGGATNTPLTLNVGGTTLYGLQSKPGWNQWGELPPTLAICNAPCSGMVNWQMNQHMSGNSLSGDATQFTLSGNEPYTDVLWSYPFIGDGAPENMKDHDHRFMPTLHNFTMDESVFVTDLAATQSLELDINMFMGGVGMEWGTQCNHLGDGVWDIWDNVNAHWMPTNAPCQLNQNAWNHVVIQVQRKDNNDLLYQSITVNGVTHPINRTVAPFPVPHGWWGMNVNFQMDGNSRSAYNKDYLDNLNVTYW